MTDLRFVCGFLHLDGRRCGEKAPRFYFCRAGDEGMTPLCEPHADVCRAHGIDVEEHTARMASK